MTKQDEGRHQHNPQTPPSVQGEEEASGSSPGVTSDDVVADIVKETIGNEPEEGKPFSIAEEVEKDDPHNIPPPKSDLPETEVSPPEGDISIDNLDEEDLE